MDRRNFVKNGLILIGFCGAGGYAIKKFADVNGKEGVIDYDFSKIQKPCRMPFEYFEVNMEGRIYPCCATYVKYRSFGNMFEQNLSEIWAGKDFKELRDNLLKGDFSLCNRDICCYAPSEYTKDFDAKKQLPKNILLCYDQECNYKCITCRDEIWEYSDAELEKFDKEFLPKIVPFITQLDEVTFSGGDPLSSRHSRRLIKEFYKNRKNTEITINTQGYFLDENNMKELGIDKIHRVAISIHSATRKTYEKIMRQDSFDRIMRNLAFISEWKKQGKVQELALNFVVHSMNYKEMPAFVRLAEKYDAIAHFWSYKPWPSAEMHKRYKEVAVFEPWHKDYPKLQKILKEPIFKSEHCRLYPELLKIVNS